MPLFYPHFRRFFLVILAFTAILAAHLLFHLSSSHPFNINTSGNDDKSSHYDRDTHQCSSPGLQILVLTMHRYESLKRLLSSLKAADYDSCGRINLHINIDFSDDTQKYSRFSQDETFRVANEFTWDFGAKTIDHRTSNAGLRRSWLESSINDRMKEDDKDIDYIAVFEDDMELSGEYYQFLKYVHKEGYFDHDDGVASVCMYPLGPPSRTDFTCDHSSDETDGNVSYSNFLYGLQWACSWGPIWKRSAWVEMTDFVHEFSLTEELPWLPLSHRQENRWVMDGKSDRLQSLWVSRYMLQLKKYTLVYHSTCMNMGASEYGDRARSFFALNHKEAGENYASKSFHDTGGSLFVVNAGDITNIDAGLKNVVLGELRAKMMPLQIVDDWEVVKKENERMSVERQEQQKKNAERERETQKKKVENEKFGEVMLSWLMNL